MSLDQVAAAEAESHGSSLGTATTIHRSAAYHYMTTDSAGVTACVFIIEDGLTVRVHLRRNAPVTLQALLAAVDLHTLLGR